MGGTLVVWDFKTDQFEPKSNVKLIDPGILQNVTLRGGHLGVFRKEYCYADHAEVVDAGTVCIYLHLQSTRKKKMQIHAMERGGFHQVGPGQAKLKKWQFAPKSNMKLIKAR
jgi:hypothetical protein